MNLTEATTPAGNPQPTWVLIVKDSDRPYEAKPPSRQRRLLIMNEAKTQHPESFDRQKLAAMDK